MMEQGQMDRTRILGRFEQWLDSALAEEDPPAGIPPGILAGEEEPEEPPTDWHAMWSAITALTQEIKLQGRAFKQLSETLAADAEKRGRKESLGAMLEMRERLLRGLEGLKGPEADGIREQLRPSFWDRVFTRRQRELEHALSVVRAMEEGYRMSLSRLDELMTQYQIQPIECVGRPFDPRRMNAVDVEETDRAAEGTVLSVYRAGYEWNGELYRPAQVRVARKPANGGVA